MTRHTPLVALIIASLAHATPPAKPAAKKLEPVRVFRAWHVGFFPGDWGRTTLTLTTSLSSTATLELKTEAPVPQQRDEFNPKDWVEGTDKAARHEGKFKDRKGGARTYWFETFALVCTPKSAPVHAAHATVEWGDDCTPCYDPCKGRAVWKPAKTETLRGLSCRVLRVDQVDDGGAPQPKTDDDPAQPQVAGLRSVPEDPLFFVATPGVELLRGRGDCPPEGFRFAQ